MAYIVIFRIMWFSADILCDEQHKSCSSFILILFILPNNHIFILFLKPKNLHEIAKFCFNISNKKLV